MDDTVPASIALVDTRISGPLTIQCQTEMSPLDLDIIMQTNGSIYLVHVPIGTKYSHLHNLVSN